MKRKYSLSELSSIDFKINKPSIIFLKWDLWSWKTTLSKHIINSMLWVSSVVNSPTYTYYNKYEDIYHFDLYRVENYDHFFAIWWEDVLDNNNGVIIIEWPEIIEKYYSADIIITLEKIDESTRMIEIQKKESF
jgi:tRNA threonylcarbamoyladenosine biosynthesis protein TsaE